jgi:hypothetical protein
MAVSVESLSPLENNPRVGNIDAIMASYSEFGQVKPIVAKKISSSLATSGLISLRKYNIITDDPKIKPNKTFGLKTKFNIISFLRFIRLFYIFESQFLRYFKF